MFDMTQPSLTSGEKLWLLALNRGPFAPAPGEPVMSDALRESLIAKGLISQKMGLVQITLKGSSVANELIRAA
jgi:hypothetical protein